jgi:hypothetical protein
MVSTFGCIRHKPIGYATLRLKFQILTCERAYTRMACGLISLCSNYVCSCLFHDLRITSADAFYSTPPHPPVFFFIFQSDFPFSVDRNVSSAQVVSELNLEVF